MKSALNEEKVIVKARQELETKSNKAKQVIIYIISKSSDVIIINAYISSLSLSLSLSLYLSIYLSLSVSFFSEYLAKRGMDRNSYYSCE